jgi:hypothetical protein
MKKYTLNVATFAVTSKGEEFGKKLTNVIKYLFSNDL